MTISKFPVDAPKQKVVRALQSLGFRVIREKEHISLERTNTDGTKTPMTLPNHDRIKSSTLRTICTQASISREDFLKAYEGDIFNISNENLILEEKLIEQAG